MLPKLVSDIVALPGWNGPMMMFLGKATLILIAALGITVAMQRASAGARHLVWLVTLGTLLFVPALAAWSPLRLEILPPSAAAPASVNASAPTTATGAVVSATSTGNDSRVSATTLNDPPSATGAPRSTATDTLAAGLSGLSMVFVIWAGVVLLIAGWLGYGALVVRRIVRQAHPLDTQDWMTPLWEVADRLELDEVPRLLSSGEAKMPFACGFLSPTIVLPVECESWSPDRRRAVLLHELAHVKRRDLVGHTLGRLACAVYWFHPLVWTAAKQLRNESERACDDLAISCGARASDYAEHLLDIVTSVRHDSTPAVALAMARRKEFEGRMLAILDPELRHSSPSRAQSLALVGSLAMIAIVVGAAAPAPRVVRSMASEQLPTLKQAPAIDKDFTPQDVAEPQQISTDDPKVRIADKISSDITKSVSKEVTDAVTKTMTNSVTASVQNAVVTAIGDGLAAKAFEKLGVDLGQRSGAKAPDDRPILLANILRTESDASLRRIAAWGLSEYGETEVAADALSTALRRDTDVTVREMAAWSLSECDGSSTAVTALSVALRADASDRVRGTSAWSLGQIGDRDAVDALSVAVSDGSKYVRSRAVWAIGQIEPREAPRAVIALLRDPDPGMRELAAWALYQIEDPGSIPALNAALKAESSKDLQISYIRALGAVGEKSVDALRDLLQSPDPKIKSIAVRALAGGNAAGPWPWPWPEPRPFP